MRTQIPRQRQVLSAVDVHDVERHLVGAILFVRHTNDSAVRLDSLAMAREVQNEFDTLMAGLEPVAAAVGRSL